jgi:hypothetical protein
MPNYLHETVEVSKVSESHQIYPVWSKSAHQNGHQAQPENLGLLTFRFWCPSFVGNGFSHNIPRGTLSGASEGAAVLARGREAYDIRNLGRAV